MDATKLAQAMLLWEQRKRKLEELEKEIVEAVLEGGETVKVGNVTASFRDGRKTYDYASVSKGAEKEIVAKYTLTTTVTTTKVDHRAICKEAKIEAPFKQGDPGVTLKLLS